MLLPLSHCFKHLTEYRNYFVSRINLLGQVPFILMTQLDWLASFKLLIWPICPMILLLLSSVSILLLLLHSSVGQLLFLCPYAV